MCLKYFYTLSSIIRDFSIREFNHSRQPFYWSKFVNSKPHTSRIPEDQYKLHCINIFVYETRTIFANSVFELLTESRPVEYRGSSVFKIISLMTNLAARVWRRVFCRPASYKLWCGTRTLVNPGCRWCWRAPDPLILAAIWRYQRRLPTRGIPPPIVYVIKYNFMLYITEGNNLISKSVGVGLVISVLNNFYNWLKYRIHKKEF